jgi:hypothetical protein
MGVGGTRADDHVVPAQIERFDPLGHPGEKIAVTISEWRRKLLKGRSSKACLVEHVPDLGLIVEKSVNRSGGIHFTEYLKGTFRAS